MTKVTTKVIHGAATKVWWYTFRYISRRGRSENATVRRWGEVSAESKANVENECRKLMLRMTEH